MSTFDPAAHLHKQGWKGKGTALKQGHATRPLAVVQKKNLGGIGRDRDEAIPFWDQIFASTAASIFTPSPTPSGSSTPIPLNSSHTSTRSWTTTTFGAPTVQIKKTGGVSVAARVNKEQAKKGLYSRFMRGKVVEPEPEEATNEEGIAGPSHSVPISESTTSIPNENNDKAKIQSKGKGKGREKEREGETKEEKRIRRAEKSKRKKEREERRSLKLAGGSVPNLDASQEEGEGGTKRKRKDANVTITEGVQVEAGVIGKKRKAGEDQSGETVESVVRKEKKEKKAKKAKAKQATE